MKRLGVVLLRLDGILVHRRSPPSILSTICWFPFIHLGGTAVSVLSDVKLDVDSSVSRLK